MQTVSRIMKMIRKESLPRKYLHKVKMEYGDIWAFDKNLKVRSVVANKHEGNFEVLSVAGDRVEVPRVELVVETKNKDRQEIADAFIRLENTLFMKMVKVALQNNRTKFHSFRKQNSLTYGNLKINLRKPEYLGVFLMPKGIPDVTLTNDHAFYTVGMSIIMSNSVRRKK